MLEKIISGGQTGADVGGVMAAKLYGIKTGGTMPLGFICKAGPKPEWADIYGFKEHTSPKYGPRTYSNVQDSDGTIRLAFDFTTGGEKCTLKAIRDYKKPHIDVDLNNPRPVADIVNFIQHHNIKILNVAGNSDSTDSEMTGETIEYLSKVFESLGFTRQLK